MKRPVDTNCSCHARGGYRGNDWPTLDTMNPIEFNAWPGRGSLTSNRTWAERDGQTSSWGVHIGGLDKKHVHRSAQYCLSGEEHVSLDILSRPTAENGMRPFSGIPGASSQHVIWKPRAPPSLRGATVLCSHNWKSTQAGQSTEWNGRPEH